jgi:hypothetical protein
MQQWTAAQLQPFFPAITITGSTTNGRITPTIGSPSSSGSASGTITFIEDKKEGFIATSLFAGNYTSANVTIKNSANQTIASYFAQNGQTVGGSVTFLPDTYTMTWNLSSAFKVGTFGTSGMQFDLVPEPTALALFALPAIALVRGRRAR